MKRASNPCPGSIIFLTINQQRAQLSGSVRLGFPISRSACRKFIRRSLKINSRWSKERRMKGRAGAGEEIGREGDQTTQWVKQQLLSWEASVEPIKKKIYLSYIGVTWLVSYLLQGSVIRCRILDKENSLVSYQGRISPSLLKEDLYGTSITNHADLLKCFSLAWCFKHSQSLKYVYNDFHTFILLIFCWLISSEVLDSSAFLLTVCSEFQ